MTLSADEFLRRFLLHVLPRAFVRIRFFGFLTNRRRSTLLPLCHQLLSQQASESRVVAERAVAPPTSWLCPTCSTPMLLIEHLSGIVMASGPWARTTRLDTS
jgi:hypothetical protein